MPIRLRSNTVATPKVSSACKAQLAAGEEGAYRGPPLMPARSADIGLPFVRFPAPWVAMPAIFAGAWVALAAVGLR